jgi:hypothetical protein
MNAAAIKCRQVEDSLLLLRSLSRAKEARGKRRDALTGRKRRKQGMGPPG